MVLAERQNTVFYWDYDDRFKPSGRHASSGLFARCLATRARYGCLGWNYGLIARSSRSECLAYRVFGTLRILRNKTNQRNIVVFSSRRHPGALRRGRSTLLFQGRRLGWPDGSWLGCGRCLRLRLAGAAVLGLGLGVRRARDEPEQGGVCGGA